MRKLLGMLLSALGLCMTACGNSHVNNMNVVQFEAAIADSTMQLLDVRTASEYAEGHLEHAVLMDMQQSDFTSRAERTLDKKRPVAVYCRSGRRSAEAAKSLEKAGFQVINLNGGIMAWTAAGKKTVK